MLSYLFLDITVQLFSLVCADNTTTGPQGTGRKRGRGDGEGADSEPGIHWFQLPYLHLKSFTNSRSFSLNTTLCVPALMNTIVLIIL
jgi:hypothetical protein